MTNNISYIDTEFIKNLDKEFVSPEKEFWKPVDSTFGSLYINYIQCNMTFIILFFLIVVLLLYRYRTVKNDKENYPEKYIKNDKYIKNIVSYEPETIYKKDIIQSPITGTRNFPNSIVNQYNQGYLTQPFFSNKL